MVFVIFKDTSYAWAKNEHPLDVLLRNFVKTQAIKKSERCSFDKGSIHEKSSKLKSDL